jgi:chaperone modulatory protein CbpM
MSSFQTNLVVEHLQVIDGEMLHADDIARICCVTTHWVHTRIEQEILHAVMRDGTYYFSSQMLYRAKQVANIEHQYDADPQLAALVADLVEEVRALREQRPNQSL